MSSKYTRQTGDGYLGIHRCGSGKATVSLGMADVDWQLGDEIVATRGDDGIKLQPATHVSVETDRLGTYEVSDQGHGLNVTVGGPALRAIGMPDEVRVYDDGDALLIVDADDDPRIMTDGGTVVPDPDDFAIPTIEELDQMRVAQDLNQRDLSRRAGVEPSRFNHILHNDVDPHVSTLRAFLHALRDADEADVQEVEHGPDPTPSPNAGRSRCWDGEDCPNDDCDGDLQQQDRLNVTCLTCEDVWTHTKDDEHHKLQTANFETVATKQRVVADGGFRSTYSEWSRRITTKGGMSDLVTDLEVGLQNAWVDIRRQNDFGEYEPVTIDVTVTVTGGDIDD